jgi:hypothetical protein
MSALLRICGVNAGIAACPKSAGETNCGTTSLPDPDNLTSFGDPIAHIGYFRHKVEVDQNYSSAFIL